MASFKKRVREKHTVNDAIFITYSNNIYFSGFWLDKCDYIIHKWNIFLYKMLHHGLKHWEYNNLKVGNLSEKYDVYTVQDKER